MCNNFPWLHVSLNFPLRVCLCQSEERSATGCRLSSVWSWEMGTSLFYFNLQPIEPNPILPIESRGVGAGDGAVDPLGIKFDGHVLRLSHKGPVQALRNISTNFRGETEPLLKEGRAVEELCVNL